MIVVVAEQKGGRLNRASWEAIAAAQELAGGATPIKAVLVGEDLAGVAGELAQAEVAEVLTADTPTLANYTADGFVQALEQIIARESPTHVIFAHTYQTRDFAPALATRLGRALITDVINIKSEGSAAVFARPMFQGKLVADVAAEGPTPHLVSVQIGAFRADAVRRGAASAPVTDASVPIDAAAIRQQVEPPFQEAKQAVDLSQAARIVAVGRGIKQQENIGIAEK
ncbi:MAG: electron transfer flavoprotein subunit alpha/FixB family protein, partial [Acidobacteria bacterium]|nr:electron transfer flavoprotein subunit alpha/FixB family protein [Acidobacteriota bacterium]